MQPILNNIGPFWDKHPDVWPGVKRYIDKDRHDKVLECWERNEEGVMVDVTEIERARLELIEAAEELANMEEDYDD